VSSTSSSTTSEDSEDLQREHDEVVVKCCSSIEGNPSQATKLQFMSAVGECSLIQSSPHILTLGRYLRNAGRVG
jgi:hypothetical protein